MSLERPRLVYLCADRGIPLGGVKGASVHVGEFLHALREERFDVHTVAARYTSDGRFGPNYSSLAPLEEPLAPFFEAALSRPGDRRTLRETRDLLLNTGVTSELAALHKDRPIELIYERYSLFGFAARTFAARHAIPYLLEVNAPLILEAVNFRELGARDLAEQIAHYLFSTADHVVAVSRTVAEYVTQVAPEARVTVIPNGVDPRRFDPQPAGRTRSEGDFVVGFVGSARPWHGLDHLIDAFGVLAGSDGGARLRIVGDTGALDAKLRRQCADLGLDDRVDFTGAVPLDTIPLALAGLDVAVAPYPPLENFYYSPLKIFEYMAAGLPIVASAIGQICEVLEHERTALLVPPGDRDALVAALTRLRQDAALRQRLGRAARDEAFARHTWQARLVTLKAIVAELLEHTPVTGAKRAAQV